MAATVTITRMDNSARELRVLAAKRHDGGQARRLLALALILEGHPRHVAAELCGMDPQSLRDWVHLYNAEGPSGLFSIRTGGRKAALTEAQMLELRELTIKGPDPDKDDVGRWRCIDLR